MDMCSNMLKKKNKNFLYYMFKVAKYWYLYSIENIKKLVSKLT